MHACISNYNLAFQLWNELWNSMRKIESFQIWAKLVSITQFKLATLELQCSRIALFDVKLIDPFRSGIVTFIIVIIIIISTLTIIFLSSKFYKSCFQLMEIPKTQSCNFGGNLSTASVVHWTLRSPFSFWLLLIETWSISTATSPWRNTYWPLWIW